MSTKIVWVPVNQIFVACNATGPLDNFGRLEAGLSVQSSWGKPAEQLGPSLIAKGYDLALGGPLMATTDSGEYEPWAELPSVDLIIPNPEYDRTKDKSAPTVKVTIPGPVATKMQGTKYRILDGQRRAFACAYWAAYASMNGAEMPKVPIVVVEHDDEFARVRANARNQSDYTAQERAIIAVAFAAKNRFLQPADVANLFGWTVKPTKDGKGVSPQFNGERSKLSSLGILAIQNPKVPIYENLKSGKWQIGKISKELLTALRGEGTQPKGGLIDAFADAGYVWTKGKPATAQTVETILTDVFEGTGVKSHACQLSDLQSLANSQPADSVFIRPLVAAWAKGDKDTVRTLLVRADTFLSKK